ncbi:hypothetical protein D9611_001961 [Ephemerocybe angulata]|uniref:F-box domain-containing protein n=1 Tax=Ephemerocybe angulata TaxID=980116 RepID=A0A8H5CHY3_9AGAR|nr:hypothetical protein D9611_001961 [Tulosesus angulatus]
MPPKDLASLPVELLSLILQELGLEDIFNARQVCRSMHTASCARQVWSSLVLKSLGQSLPRPFFLPKPLQECSSLDIENSIRRWEADWTPKSPVQTARRPVIRGGKVDPLPRCLSICMVPGGQFVLAGLVDGSVWSFDISDDWTSTSSVEAKLLIPSSFPPSEGAGGAIDVLLAIDYISEEALGPNQDACYLSQFNLAVIACPTRSESSNTVGVWRVHLSQPTSELPSGRQAMRLGEHLSSFKDSKAAFLYGASLLGKDLAYSMESPPAGCTVIVNWEEARGKTEGDELLRWYIDRAVRTVHLLPGDRILVVDGNFIGIVNWRLRWPTSTLSPGRQELRPIHYPWSRVLKSQVSGISISPPLILQGTARLVVPTFHEAFSLIIPIDNYDLEAIRFQSLLKAEFGFACNQKQLVFGHRRAVGMEDYRGKHFLSAAQYRFPGETTAPYSPKFQWQPHDTFDPTSTNFNFTTHLLYDQYTNRIVQTDHRMSYFIMVSSYASHTVDPGKSSVLSSEIQKIGSAPWYNGESESEVGSGSSEEGKGEEKEGGDEEEGEEETGEEREEEETNSDDDDAPSVVEDTTDDKNGDDEKLDSGFDEGVLSDRGESNALVDEDTEESE